jgi:uncharacterized protein YjdB
VILKVGENSKATATISPSNASNKNVTWSSNNTSVAKVSSNGTITAMSVGSAVITAKSSQGGYTDTCVVTVKSNTISVTGIIVSPATMNLNVGQTSSVSATVSPSNASNKNVTWSSNNTSIANVTSSGTVTGVSEGTAVITGTTDNGGYADTCVVTVKSNVVYVTGISVSPATLNLNTGETYNAVATVYPSNATNKNVTWSSNNTSVANVSSNGTITGVYAGTAVITARTSDGGYTDTCVVTVRSNVVSVTGINVSPDTMNLKVGQSSGATANVYPSNATNKNVTWSSNNTSIARVSSNGTITGVSEGTAVITGTTSDGGYTDTCIVYVKADEVVTPNATVKITFGDHIDGATDIFASVVLSESGKTPKIESNLNYTVVKVSDTVYHVCMTITEGSHGTAAISVTGTGITSAELSMGY